MKNKYLKLIKKNNKEKDCSLFTHFQEKYEVTDKSQIILTTKTNFEAVSLLYDYLGNPQNTNNCSLTSITYTNFENIKSNLKYILNELLRTSEELKHQEDTFLVKIPQKLNLKIRSKYKKTLSFKNYKNENFLILTNNDNLIKLYETI